MSGYYGTLEERFWKRVNKNGETSKSCLKLGRCWIWTGSLVDFFHRGYIRRDKIQGEERGKLVLVHRISWELNYGEIPKGICVCHKCDVPSCVNPNHLFLGSLKDNTRDMILKKRSRGYCGVGEMNCNSKLTSEKVEAIRFLYSLKGITQQVLADCVGISQANISEILLGNIWNS